ncbi:hypothetical protein NYR30_06910 [Gallibacterium salpingitidis]|uniref:hypothetical protein n=1 Tax=Gallibacterium salpingitidis TaxID=505341 RepID=UPI00267043CB|nr:hypothetical protein [Gallibacterium salpingitidis]WKS98519.1 hypothetical protein NYR30_06910 [Gallibacterium salpingitidis]
MIIEIPTTKQVNVKYIKLVIPIRFGDEDIPYDFPLRDGDQWCGIIDLDTFKIENWPKNYPAKMNMKICDDGEYYLLDENRNIIGTLVNDYIPHCVPNNYGDYIDLHIDEAGKIKNMPHKLIFDQFFRNDNE